MTAQTTLDPEVKAMYVSHCCACTLTSNQACTACCFNVGLAVRTVHVNTMSLPVEKREEYWKMLSSTAWAAYVDYLDLTAEHQAESMAGCI